VKDKQKIKDVAFKKTDTKNKCGWCGENHKWIDCEQFIEDRFHEDGAKAIIGYVKGEKELTAKAIKEKIKTIRKKWIKDGYKSKGGLIDDKEWLGRMFTLDLIESEIEKWCG